MHIGEVARRAGLSVKTVRYYSDLGLVPEADRSMSGYRRYDTTALVRLEFVRTLRELGLDLATIRKVLERDADLPAVAAAHAEALSTQIRVLRMQRAALRAIARRELTRKDIDHMNRIAQATADERRRIIEEFVDSIFTGVEVDPAREEDARRFQARMRGATPELPDDPTDEQVDAWLELADLVRDEDFRGRLREMSARSFGGGGSSAFPTGPAAMSLAQLVTGKAGPAADAGLDPTSAEARPVVDELAGAFAAAAGRTDDAAYRRELADGIDSGNDPRAERYWQLMATINGWPPVPSTGHLWTWFAQGLRHRSC
jgi:DNA-binding transcriptional MerR regulator